jgi:hypothetical protein
MLGHVYFINLFIHHINKRQEALSFWAKDPVRSMKKAYPSQCEVLLNKIYSFASCLPVKCLLRIVDNFTLPIKPEL